MKQNVLLLYKKLGETPLDTITRYKAKHATTTTKLSFAGRLDPMAEGLLVVLKDEENKQRQSYEALPKTYECSFVCGFATDTYDILGKVTHIQDNLPPVHTLQKILRDYVTNTMPGEKIQAYPPYSSFHLKGKPLYYWERKGELDHANLPTKKISIHAAEILRDEMLLKEILAEEFDKRLLLVKGNFRQKEIQAGWEAVFKKSARKDFLQTHLRITCSSGTYIRGLIHTLGRDLGIPSVTTAIRRTSVGSFSLADLSWYEK